MKILIAYASTHGSTAAIADRLAARLRAKGLGVVVGDVRTLARDASHFDGIIVGGRVWGSGYPRRLTRFVHQNLGALRAKPSAFFSVGLWNVSRLEDHRAEAKKVPARFLARAGWRPDRVELISGTLAFSRAWGGTIGRRVLGAIWKADLGDLDMRRDHVFTDWDQVDAFADAFRALLSPPREDAFAHHATMG